MNTRRRLFLVVGVLLLAFTLRITDAPSRPLWYDEAFSVLFSSLTPAEMIRTTVSPVEGMGGVEVHPPLYPFLLHLWIQLLGTSPLAIRLLSVFLGMLAVASLWRLASWSFNRETGLVVGLLVAVNPFHVVYSQEARMYALLTLTTLAAAWGILRALEAEDRPHRWTWWGLYAIGAALTMYTHSLGAFTLLALNLLDVIRDGRHRLLDLVLANLAAVALYSPWLVAALPAQLAFVGQRYWLEPPGVDAVLRALMLPVFTFYEPAPVWLLGLELFTGTLLLTFLILQIWRRRQTRARWFLLLAFAPILGMMALSLWRPVYLERALLPAALFYLIALGWLLTRANMPPILTRGLAALFLVTTAGSLWSHVTYVGFPRPPFPAAVAFLREHVEPSHAVVHTNKLSYLPIHYYDPDLSGTFLTDPPGSGQDTLSPHIQEALGLSAATTITEAVGGADTVWLIYFSREIQELEAAGAESEALTWMERAFSTSTRRQFVDLEIVAYRRATAARMTSAPRERRP